jgi:hypothetical protein
VSDIAAMDVFVVPTIGFDLLYAFIIIRLDRRDLVWINVTIHPTAEWIARQITAAFPWNDAPRYLIRDRDRVYGDIVTRRLRAIGIRDKPIAPGSPWQNGFAERLIGSIRRECVDHFIVLGEAHLRRILQAYARYYNEIRPHRSLNKDAPVSRPVQRIGNVKSPPNPRRTSSPLRADLGFRYTHLANSAHPARSGECDGADGRAARRQSVAKTAAHQFRRRYLRLSGDRDRRYAFLGHDEWADYAPGLKRIEDVTRFLKLMQVRFTPESRHVQRNSPCPLWAKSAFSHSITLSAQEHGLRKLQHQRPRRAVDANPNARGAT